MEHKCRTELRDRAETFTPGGHGHRHEDDSNSANDDKHPPGDPHERTHHLSPLRTRHPDDKPQPKHAEAGMEGVGQNHRR